MTRPTAAPNYFPYAHRTLDVVDRYERNLARKAEYQRKYQAAKRAKRETVE